MTSGRIPVDSGADGQETVAIVHPAPLSAGFSGARDWRLRATLAGELWLDRGRRGSIRLAAADTITALSLVKPRKRLRLPRLLVTRGYLVWHTEESIRLEIAGGQPVLLALDGWAPLGEMGTALERRITRSGLRDLLHACRAPGARAIGITTKASEELTEKARRVDPRAVRPLARVEVVGYRLFVAAAILGDLAGHLSSSVDSALVVGPKGTHHQLLLVFLSVGVGTFILNGCIWLARLRGNRRLPGEALLHSRGRPQIAVVDTTITCLLYDGRVVSTEASRAHLSLLLHADGHVVALAVGLGHQREPLPLGLLLQPTWSEPEIMLLRERLTALGATWSVATLHRAPLTDLGDPPFRRPELGIRILLVGYVETPFALADSVIAEPSAPYLAAFVGAVLALQVCDALLVRRWRQQTRAAIAVVTSR